MSEQHPHLLRARTAAALWSLGELSADLCGPVFRIENRDNSAMIPCSSGQCRGRTVCSAVMSIYACLFSFLGCDVNERETTHIPPLLSVRKFTRKFKTNFREPRRHWAPGKSLIKAAGNVPGAGEG